MRRLLFLAFWLLLTFAIAWYPAVNHAVKGAGPSHPEPVLRWAPVIVPSPTASAGATHRPTPSGHTFGASVSGTLTWYCRAGISRCTKGYPDGPGLDLYAAAGPSLRVGDWRGRLVTVCATRCIQVRLIDWCACPPPHFLDLYWDAFRLVGPGRATVTW